MVAFANRTIPSPLLCFPADNRGFANPGFETAFSGSDWTAGGTAAATRTTTAGQFFSGVAAAKFNPGIGQTSFISQTRTMANAPDYKITGNLEPFVVHFMLNQTVGNGVDAIAVTLETRNGGATVETLMSSVAAAPSVSGWDRWFCTATPTTYAAVDGIYIKIGFLAATTAAATAYVDDLYVGHWLDFQNMGPNTSGVFTTVKWNNSYNRVVNYGVDGTATGGARNSGLSQFELKSSLFNDTARTSYRQYFDYCSDGTAFTFYETQTGLRTSPSYPQTRFYVQSAIIDQETDGLSQMQGSPYHSFTLRAREVKY